MHYALLVGYIACMSLLQIRNVPDEARRALKARASALDSIAAARAEERCC